jgi:membrane protein implicated in regulation of membrane protease activity
MRGKTLYIASFIVIAAPWMFLLEIIPVSYSRIGTAAEVTIEAVMFAALLAVVIFLKKELKRLRRDEGEKNRRAYRNIGRLLFVLACITLFLVGLILALIAISFTL